MKNFSKIFPLLSEVLAHIQQGHLESPEPKKLMYGAIRGMLRTLDPYSQFSILKATGISVPKAAALMAVSAWLLDFAKTV